MAMSGYTKLFNSILASTIWDADMPTRIVWITLLAMADKNGVAEGSLPGLAKFARVTRKDCERALKILIAPDPDSRSQEYGGRRIMPVDGGWMLLNHAKYRTKLNEDERREYLRVKQAEYRRQHKSTTVNNRQQPSTVSTQAEADTEADTDTKAEEDQTPVVSGFETFWTSYPRKVGKGAARDEWQRLHPSADLTSTIIAALNVQKTSDQWTKDGGQFIPHAKTWLHQKRWEDEPDNRAPTLTHNPKTEHNLDALRSFAARGDRDRR